MSLQKINFKPMIEKFFINKERFGFDKESANKFNFAIIKRESTLTYEEFWILSNAYYDYDIKRFIKIDPNRTSFGIQFQANGTYPGEEGIDNYNIGINVWRNPRKDDVEAAFPGWRTDSTYDFAPFMNNNHIGLGSKSNADVWNEFAVFSGWSNSFMIDSYGGMTIGGAGFEIDGNGIFPFTRVTSSRYTANNKTWHLLGLLDNAYHPTKGSSQCDDNSTYSWFVGLRTPAQYDNSTPPKEKDLLKDNTQAEFVVMYNDTQKPTTGAHAGEKDYLNPENWHTVFSVGVDGLDMATKEDVSNKTNSMNTTNKDTKYPTVQAVENYAQPIGNYLTEHQNISGKEDNANKTNSMSVNNNEKSTKYPTVQAVENYIDEIIGDINEDLMS